MHAGYQNTLMVFFILLYIFSEKGWLSWFWQLIGGMILLNRKWSVRFVCQFDIFSGADPFLVFSSSYQTKAAAESISSVILRSNSRSLNYHSTWSNSHGYFALSSGGAFLSVTETKFNGNSFKLGEFLRADSVIASEKEVLQPSIFAFFFLKSCEKKFVAAMWPD